MNVEHEWARGFIAASIALKKVKIILTSSVFMGTAFTETLSIQSFSILNYPISKSNGISQYLQFLLQTVPASYDLDTES